MRTEEAIKNDITNILKMYDAKGVVINMSPPIGTVAVEFIDSEQNYVFERLRADNQYAPFTDLLKELCDSVYRKRMDKLKA
ncbi:MAG: hypothetical protein PHU12_02085 [Candidatus Aenigmarchaeota archaeon]|nr:hypothetical protein [Candidatus Aenigmarchaeota archaeon]